MSIGDLATRPCNRNDEVKFEIDKKLQKFHLQHLSTFSSVSHSTPVASNYGRNCNEAMIAYDDDAFFKVGILMFHRKCLYISQFEYPHSQNTCFLSFNPYICLTHLATVQMALDALQMSDTTRASTLLSCCMAQLIAARDRAGGGDDHRMHLLVRITLATRLLADVTDVDGQVGGDCSLYNPSTLPAELLRQRVHLLSCLSRVDRLQTVYTHALQSTLTFLVEPGCDEWAAQICAAV